MYHCAATGSAAWGAKPPPAPSSTALLENGSGGGGHHERGGRGVLALAEAILHKLEPALASAESEALCASTTRLSRGSSSGSSASGSGGGDGQQLGGGAAIQSTVDGLYRALRCAPALDLVLVVAGLHPELVESPGFLPLMAQLLSSSPKLQIVLAADAPVAGSALLSVRPCNFRIGAEGGGSR